MDARLLLRHQQPLEQDTAAPKRRVLHIYSIASTVRVHLVHVVVHPVASPTGPFMMPFVNQRSAKDVATTGYRSPGDCERVVVERLHLFGAPSARNAR